MWLLRLLAVLTVIAVAGGVLAFIHLRTRAICGSRGVFSAAALIVALLVFALLILERVAVIPAQANTPAAFPAPHAAGDAGKDSLSAIKSWLAPALSGFCVPFL